MIAFALSSIVSMTMSGLALTKIALPEDPGGEVKACFKQADLAAEKGDTKVVLESVGRAVALSGKIHGLDQPAHAKDLVLASGYYEGVARIPSALSAYERALAIWEGPANKNHTDNGTLGRAHYEVARLALAMHVPDKAALHLDKCFGILKVGTGFDDVLASGYNSMGCLYDSIGDPSQARSNFKNALDLAGKDIKFPKPLLMTFRLNLANSFSQELFSLPKDDPAYATKFKSAYDLYKIVGEYYLDGQRELTHREQAEFLLLLKGMSTLLIHLGKANSAERFLRNAVQKMERFMVGEFGAIFYSELGHTLARQEKWDEAEVAFARAVKLLKDDPPLTPVTLDPNTELYLLKSLKKRQHEEAVEYLGASLSGRLRRVAEGFRYQTESERSSALLTCRLQLGNYLSVALASDRPAEEIYQHILDWKGVLFARTAAERAVMDESVLEKLRRLRDALADSKAWLSRERGNGKLSVDEWKAQALKRKVDEERAQRDLSAEIDLALRRKGDTATLSLSEFKKSLPEKNVFVDYVVYPSVVLGKEGFAHEDRLLAFIVVPGDKVRYVPIQENIASVMKSIKEWDDLLLQNNDAGDGPHPKLATSAADLAAKVWKPVLAHLPSDRRIVLSPDGPVWHVPFAALPGKAKDAYLLQETELAYVFSARHLYDQSLKLCAYSVPPNNKGLYVVADIDYGPQKTVGDWPRLGNLAPWIEGTKTLYGKSHPLAVASSTGRAADAEQVLDRFQKGYSEVVFIGHGPNRLAGIGADKGMAIPTLPPKIPMANANADDPLWGGRNTPGLDQIRLSNLYGVSTFWWWGCSLLSGPTPSGQGVIGFPAALHGAGCQSVLASRWVVDVGTSSTLALDAHRGVWEGGKSPSKSLHDAQRNALLNAVGLRKHPRFWAGWIMIGDVPK